MAGQLMVVIGSGPAGVRAAETLVAAGLRPTVIEESTRDGGQIYRRQPATFGRSYKTLYGTEAARAANLHSSFEALRDNVDYRPNSLVWNITDRCVHIVEGIQASSLQFDALIIASGSTDRLMPVRGWNMAGVFSLGAAQIALKSQACAIGHRVVFLGTGPLLYLVALQYLKAGANVAAVLDTSPAMGRVKALLKLATRPSALLKGIAILTGLRRRGVIVETGITPLEISGDPERGVSGIRVRTASGVEHKFTCDAVGLGYHLRPETQLADLARCDFFFEPTTHQWLPQTDVDGRATTSGIYLAGDGSRLLGADGAEDMGRLAALAALADAGQTIDKRQVARLRRSVARMDRFRSGLAQAFPWPAQAASALPDDAVVCRCEAITAGDIRSVVQKSEANELNRAKAFTRVGMGRCQGRYCGHAAAEVIAAAAGVPVELVGRLRGQAPVKPLSIATEAVGE